MNVAIYCGSSFGNNKIYEESTKILAKKLALKNYNIVYGGSEQGLMGIISNESLKYNNKVIGVITFDLAQKELENKNITEIYRVNTIDERKEKMAMMADAAVALPGGCGTLEELLDVITWKQLGIFTKPIIIVNIDGYYDSLIDMLHRAVEENFMRELHKDIWTVVGSVEEVVDAIRISPKWDKSVRKFAAL